MGRDIQAGLKGEKAAGDNGVLARGDDLNCDGGRANGDKGANVRDSLRKNPGDLVAD